MLNMHASPLPFTKEQILHPSPPPVGRNVLDALKASGHRNNLSAYHIQKELHKLFIRPDFPSLPDSVKVQMRRVQGIAFEGYYPELPELETLSASLATEESAIRRLGRDVIDRICHLLESQAASWEKIEEGASELGFNGNGDMVRIWQDHAAVDLFTRDFGGRIAVFGSARIGPETTEYRAVEWLSGALVEGMANEEGKSEQIVSGAGPGIMKAANKGALRGEWKVLRSLMERFRDKPNTLEEMMLRFREQIHSAGFRVMLPFEAGYNSHLQMNITIKNFGPRKQGLVAGSCGRSVTHDGAHRPWHGRHPAFFITKGGFGTEDEMWEVLTLLQCGKMPGTPVFLLGRDTRVLIQDILQRMQEWGTIDPKDRNLLIPCDTEVEALRSYVAFHKIDPSLRMGELLSERKPILT